MQHTYVCLRCRLHSLSKSLPSRPIQQRLFTSVRRDPNCSEAQVEQNDLIPPKQKESAQRQPRSQPLRDTRGNPPDESVNAILALFDANRHKQPSSTTLRYSRQHVYDPLSPGFDNAEQRNHRAQRRNSDNLLITDQAGKGSAEPSPNIDGETHDEKLAKLHPSTAAQDRAHTMVNAEAKDSNLGLYSRKQWASKSSRSAPLSDAKSLQSRNSVQTYANTLAAVSNTTSPPGDLNLTDLSTEEAVFAKQLDHIESLAASNTSGISTLLAACQDLQPPSENPQLKAKFHRTLQIVAEKFILYCDKPRKLPSVHKDLPLLIRWHQKHQSNLAGWHLKLIWKYLENFWKAFHFHQKHPRHHSFVGQSTILQGILMLWRNYISFTTNTSNFTAPEASDTSSLPTVEKIILQRKELPTNFSRRIQHFFPNIPEKELPSVSSLISLTCALIDTASRQSSLTSEAVREADAFFDTFCHMMQGTEFESIETQKFQEWDAHQKLQSVWLRFQSSISERLSFLQGDLLANPSRPDGGLLDRKIRQGHRALDHNIHNDAEIESDTVQGASLRFSEILGKDDAGNHKRIRELWPRFRSQIETKSSTQEDLSSNINDFLWSFASQRNLASINEVWTVMIKAGVHPTTSHWNAILDALQRNREFVKLQQIWQDMLRSGCQPNNTSWTIQINALLQQKQWTSALRLIDDMSYAWKQAMKAVPSLDIRKFDDAQRLPSIVPVNAAITGLLRLNLPNIAKDVLKWAQEVPLEIDAATYNIFLLDQCKRGSITAAESIIKDMENNNISPDVITATIMLDTKIRNPGSPLHKLKADEQEEAVLKELQRMTDRGQPPNAQTFAVVLQSLLHVAKPNLPAANAVFRLLLQQEQGIPPHIYTILFVHHFKSENPDLDALDILWGRVKREKSTIDQFLYCKMIEGYAMIGEIRRMMSIFKQMIDSGLPPTWTTMRRVLSAFVQQRRWDLCADFVSDATCQPHIGSSSRRDRREFWQLVRELEQQNLIPVVKSSSKALPLGS